MGKRKRYGSRRNMPSVSVSADTFEILRAMSEQRRCSLGEVVEDLMDEEEKRG